MKTANSIFIGLFAATGTGSLAGVLFAGATHQLFMVAISAGIILILLSENKKQKK